MQLCVLASGSGGNATIVLPARGEPILVDAGLSPRATLERLEAAGLPARFPRHLVLTHLDCDHFHRGWVKVIRETDITVHLHERHRNRAVHLGVDGRALRLFRARFAPHDGVAIDPLLLAHDQLGTVGFVIESERVRVGFATDLGSVPSGFSAHFRRLDALAIESNYDPELQRSSGRPAFLKRRITGGRGHLSNAQSVAAVRAIAQGSSLAHVVTLHLSRECNTPRHVRDAYARHAPGLLRRLTISGQHEPTPVITVERQTQPGEQLMLL